MGEANIDKFFYPNKACPDYGKKGKVQRSYLLVLWVEVPPLQFSVGNVVIPDSGWSDPMAESSEGLRTSQDDPTNDKDRSYNRRWKWKGGLQTGG